MGIKLHIIRLDGDKDNPQIKQARRHVADTLRLERKIKKLESKNV